MAVVLATFVLLTVGSASALGVDAEGYLTNWNGGFCYADFSVDPNTLAPPTPGAISGQSDWRTVEGQLSFFYFNRWYETSLVELSITPSSGSSTIPTVGLRFLFADQSGDGSYGTGPDIGVGYQLREIALGFQDQLDEVQLGTTLPSIETLRGMSLRLLWMNIGAPGRTSIFARGVTDSVTIVPEPGTALLLSGGLAALAGTRRRTVPKTR